MIARNTAPFEISFFSNTTKLSIFYTWTPPYLINMPRSTKYTNNVNDIKWLATFNQVQVFYDEDEYAKT